MAWRSADGIAQLGCSAHGGVLGEVVLNGRYGCFLDVRRSIEVRLACAEVDQVDARGAEFFRFSGNRHGG